MSTFTFDVIRSAAKCGFTDIQIADPVECRQLGGQWRHGSWCRHQLPRRGLTNCVTRSEAPPPYGAGPLLWRLSDYEILTDALAQNVRTPSHGETVVPAGQAQSAAVHSTIAYGRC